MPKKPLPPELQPQPTSLTPVADDDPLRPHLFELIAAAVNGGAKVRWWDLTNLKAGSQVLGNWRITVERIDD